MDRPALPRLAAGEERAARREQGGEVSRPHRSRSTPEQSGRAAGAAVLARLTLTGLNIPEYAGIKIRIQMISFPDPVPRQLPDEEPGRARISLICHRQVLECAYA